ncbi:MAG: VOC family protein [bacterium]|nr:VOC family protein [bacterium]
MNNNHNFPTLGPIVIGTTDMERAKKFYTAVFGISILNDESSHYVSARGVDGTHVELEGDSPHRFPDWVKHNVGTYKNSEFFVTDIQAFLQNVEKHGGTTVTKPTPRPWGGFGAEFADPDGNIFLISQK